MQRDKRRTYQLLGLTSGSRILDIGCGTGDDALAMASLVGEQGKVTGLDYGQPLIEEARRRAESAGLAVEFTAAMSTRSIFPMTVSTAAAPTVCSCICATVKRLCRRWSA